MNNKTIATVRTAGATTWGTGVGLLMSWLTSLSPEALLFVVSAATLIINRLGSELQDSTNRTAKLFGDLLLWVDKLPVYDTPPTPDVPVDLPPRPGQ